ncbi:MAG: hypothetical protein JXA46_02515 [Dehalococcoidales bacterium]|nr:hypothetical protein [Dehalococcoidales bacterium]
MPGGFYIEGKKEKIDISVLVAAVAELEAKFNSLIFDSPIESTVVMDGTEQVLVEQTDGVSSLLEGYVDMSNMTGGDIIVIRQYMKIKTGGDYVKYAEETYTGAQPTPLVYISAKPANIAVKVTAEQTAGVHRSLDCQFSRRREA